VHRCPKGGDKVEVEDVWGTDEGCGFVTKRTKLAFEIDRRRRAKAEAKAKAEAEAKVKVKVDKVIDGVDSDTESDTTASSLPSLSSASSSDETTPSQSPATPKLSSLPVKLDDADLLAVLPFYPEPEPNLGFWATLLHYGEKLEDNMRLKHLKIRSRRFMEGLEPIDEEETLIALIWFETGGWGYTSHPKDQPEEERTQGVFRMSD
jgi:hypothetical protein